MVSLDRFIYTKQISYLTIFNTVLLKNLLGSLSKLRDFIILQELDNNFLFYKHQTTFHRIASNLGRRLIYKIVVSFGFP